jgi:hypothetical protein
MKKSLLSIATMAVLAGAFATGLSAKKEQAEMRAVGDPVNCVSLRSIQSTKIVTDSIIDFKMAGGKTYRNTLPYSCPSLKSEDRFSYHTSLSQLCNVDIVRVLHSYGGNLQAGVGCGLGKFQQVEKVPAG